MRHRLQRATSGHPSNHNGLRRTADLGHRHPLLLCHGARGGNLQQCHDLHLSAVVLPQAYASSRSHSRCSCADDCNHGRWDCRYGECSDWCRRHLQKRMTSRMTSRARPVGRRFGLGTALLDLGGGIWGSWRLSSHHGHIRSQGSVPVRCRCRSRPRPLRSSASSCARWPLRLAEGVYS